MEQGSSRSVLARMVAKGQQSTAAGDFPPDLIVRRPNLNPKRFAALGWGLSAAAVAAAKRDERPFSAVYVDGNAQAWPPP